MSWMFEDSCRSQWPRRLRRGSMSTHLLGLWVRIPPGAWMPVFCECWLLSGRGLCVGLITRPEESYPVWCVWVWSWSLDNGRLWPTGGCRTMGNWRFVVRLKARRFYFLVNVQTGSRVYPAFNSVKAVLTLKGRQLLGSRHDVTSQNFPRRNHSKSPCKIFFSTLYRQLS
jgi:hypothetical protein